MDAGPGAVAPRRLPEAGLWDEACRVSTFSERTVSKATTTCASCFLETSRTDGSGPRVAPGWPVVAEFNVRLEDVSDERLSAGPPAGV